MSAVPALDDYLLDLLAGDAMPPASGTTASAAPALAATSTEPESIVQATVIEAVREPASSATEWPEEPANADAIIAPAPTAAAMPATPVTPVPVSAPPPVASPAPTAAAVAIASARQAVPAYAAPVFDRLQAAHAWSAEAADTGERRRASERTTRWLRMRCDDQHYALELLKVQEVVLPAVLLPLRGAVRHMLGVMNLRGQVVPVIDMGVYLGREPVQDDPHTRIVVLEEQGEILGLRVSAVEDVTSLTDQQIEPPDNTRMCRMTHPLFRGVARLGGRTVILLDASELLR